MEVSVLASGAATRPEECGWGERRAGRTLLNGAALPPEVARASSATCSASKPRRRWLGT